MADSPANKTIAPQDVAAAAVAMVREADPKKWPDINGWDRPSLSLLDRYLTSAKNQDLSQGRGVAGFVGDARYHGKNDLDADGQPLGRSMVATGGGAPYLQINNPILQGIIDKEVPDEKNADRHIRAGLGQKMQDALEAQTQAADSFVKQHLAAAGGGDYLDLQSATEQRIQAAQELAAAKQSKDETRIAEAQQKERQALKDQVDQQKLALGLPIGGAPAPDFRTVAPKDEPVKAVAAVSDVHIHPGEYRAAIGGNPAKPEELANAVIQRTAAQTVAAQPAASVATPKSQADIEAGFAAAKQMAFDKTHGQHPDPNQLQNADMRAIVAEHGASYDNMLQALDKVRAGELKAIGASPEPARIAKTYNGQSGAANQPLTTLDAVAAAMRPGQPQVRQVEALGALRDLADKPNLSLADAQRMTDLASGSPAKWNMLSAHERKIAGDVQAKTAGIVTGNELKTQFSSGPLAAVAQGLASGDGAALAKLPAIVAAHPELQKDAVNLATRSLDIAGTKDAAVKALDDMAKADKNGPEAVRARIVSSLDQMHNRPMAEIARTEVAHLRDMEAVKGSKFYDPSADPKVEPTLLKPGKPQADVIGGGINRDKVTPTFQASASPVGPLGVPVPAFNPDLAGGATTPAAGTPRAKLGALTA